MRAGLDHGTEKIPVHADRLNRVRTNDLRAIPRAIVSEFPSWIESLCESDHLPPACSCLDDDPAGRIFKNSD